MGNGVLVGKVVVVTGAGAGLGRAYARHAAAAGATVVVNDVNAAAAEETTDEIRSVGGTAHASGHSVSDAAAVRELFEWVESDLGGVDGLVNNAGVGYGAFPWEEETERMSRSVAVNVLGTLLCGAHAITAMVRRGGGSVVNIGSGVSLGVRGRATYAATKGAVASVTYAWALDCLDKGVRVNNVSPVAVTGMTPQGFTGPGGAALNDDPGKVAPLITWLLSDLSAPMTGQTLRFDGRSLRLITHPRLGEPELRRPEWTVEDLVTAFDETFSDLLEPIGWDLTRSPRPGGVAGAGLGPV